MKSKWIRLLCILSVGQFVCACSTAPQIAQPAQLSLPRVAPVNPANANPDQKRFLDSQDASLSRLNVVRTFVVNPKLAEAWQPFAFYVLRSSTLPPREREILILRIGWLDQSQYEFTQHVRVGKAAGLKDEEIERIKAGADAPGWSTFDAALVRAADQLRANATINDAVWDVLKTRYDEKQLMDVVVTVGQYNLISWYLNALGTPLEAGVVGHPMHGK